MDIFTYTPGGAEHIDAFNARLAAYAASNNVTGVVVSTINETLVMSVAVVEDIPAALLLRPFVAVLAPGSERSLETALSSLLDKMKAEDQPDNEVAPAMSVPVECKVYAAPVDEVQVGYAVFLVAIGELEDDE
jgi:hypothetical protein